MAVAVELLPDQSEYIQTRLDSLEPTLFDGIVINFPSQNPEVVEDTEQPDLSPTRFGYRQTALPFVMSKDNNVNRFHYIKTLSHYPGYRIEIRNLAAEIFKCSQNPNHTQNWLEAERTWIITSMEDQRFLNDFHRLA